MGKDDFKSRFRKMELRSAYLAGAATVILGFLGWTNFYTIPNTVDKKISEAAGQKTIDQIKKAAGKAEKILEASKLQEKVEIIRVNVDTLKKEVEKINEVQECKDPKEVCICQRDEGKEGDDLAKLVVCVSRCPDGRLRGIEIREIVATTSKFKTRCGKLQSKVF